MAVTPKLALGLSHFLRVQGWALSWVAVTSGHLEDFTIMLSVKAHTYGQGQGDIGTFLHL